MSLLNGRRSLWREGIAAASIALVATAASASQDATNPSSFNRPAPNFAPAVDATYSGPSLAEAGPLAAPISRQVAEADIRVFDTGLDYVALIVDYDGTDNLFIKVQQQDSGGVFDSIGFYSGNNDTGWSGQTGGDAFVILDPEERFASAHMTAMHDGQGNVLLRLTDIDGTGRIMEMSRGGWTPLNGASYGMAGYSGASARMDNWGESRQPGDFVADDFDRDDGPLGPDWVIRDGVAYCENQEAVHEDFSFVTYAGVPAGGASLLVEADVRLSGTALEYAALVLNSDGTDNLYIKIQQQTGDGLFDTIGFYSGVNLGGWPGQSGGPQFFAIPPQSQFSKAHMRVILDGGGTVRLILTDLVGPGDAPLEFQRGGWHNLDGAGWGFGGYAGKAYIDDISDGSGRVCDTFNRPNGDLGANWVTDFGGASIVSMEARGYDTSRSFFVGVCGETCPGDADGDGFVTFADILILLSNWGACP